MRNQENLTPMKVKILYVSIQPIPQGYRTLIFFFLLSDLGL